MLLMLSILDQIFDPARFADAVVYFWMGAISSFIFFVRLAMMLFFGMDGVFDTELEFETESGDVGHADSDASFQIFSILSITAFFMGAGWMGFIARYDWGWGDGATAMASIGFGLFLMVLSAYLMMMTKRFDSEGGYDAHKTVGMTGKVYLTIPPKGQGTGQVEVDVDGRLKVMTARSLGDKIESFTNVTIKSVDDDETLVVEVKE